MSDFLAVDSGSGCGVLFLFFFSFVGRLAGKVEFSWFGICSSLSVALRELGLRGKNRVYCWDLGAFRYLSWIGNWRIGGSK